MQKEAVSANGDFEMTRQAEEVGGYRREARVDDEGKKECNDEDEKSAPLVHNLRVLPLDKVAQLLLARQDLGRHLAHDAILVLLRCCRVPLGEAHLALPRDEQQEADLE